MAGMAASVRIHTQNRTHEQLLMIKRTKLGRLVKAGKIKSMEE
jgi:hypothetical protein